MPERRIEIRDRASVVFVLGRKGGKSMADIGTARSWLDVGRRQQGRLAIRPPRAGTVPAGPMRPDGSELTRHRYVVSGWRSAEMYPRKRRLRGLLSEPCLGLGPDLRLRTFPSRFEGGPIEHGWAVPEIWHDTANPTPAHVAVSDGNTTKIKTVERFTDYWLPSWQCCCWV